MDKALLKLDWCSHAAAKYAVEHWHYSQSMPSGKMVCLGVWEQQRFIGCIVFSRGANRNLGHLWGLSTTAICELTRIALARHVTPVSRVVMIALRMFHSQSSGVRLIVSYADSSHGHTGAIYQAMNWTYTGWSQPQGGFQYLVNGRWQHKRSMSARCGTLADARVTAIIGPRPKRRQPQKHRYLYPMDAAMRAQIAPLAQPYPKRATSIRADASAHQAEEGGATPTVALRVE